MKYSRIIIFSIVLFLAFSCGKLGGGSFDVETPAPRSGITSVSLTKAQQSYLDNGNAFSLKLLSQMCEDKSIIISPLSVQFSLAMALNGAGGKTSEEISSLLGYGKDNLADVNEFSKTLIEELPSIDEGVTFKLANAAVSTSGYDFSSAFANTAAHYYYAPTATVDFSGESFLASLNNWASRNTDEMIDVFLDSLPLDACCLLLNALYFKAPWLKNGTQSIFSTDEAGDFLLGGGKTVKADYIKAEGYFGYSDSELFRAVSLPYSSGKFQMYVLLPKEKSITAVQGLSKDLTAIKWSSLSAAMHKNLVKVKLPKFSIQSSFELKNTLKAMGLQTPFQPDKADFSGMFKGEKSGVHLGDVLQKSRIEVNEWGTAAATVTAARLDTPASTGNEDKPLYFYADHPFIFIIADTTSNAIIYEGLFMGK